MIIILPKYIQDIINKNKVRYLAGFGIWIGTAYFAYGIGLVECGNNGGYMWIICGVIVAMCGALAIRLKRNKDNKCVKE